MIIPDINLLVYAHNSSAPEHPQSREWLEATLAGPETVGIALVVILGFVRLLSSKRVVESPGSPGELLATIEEILALSSTQLIVPSSRHLGIMRELFEATGGGPRLTTDVHLAALSLEHGATLASNDTDFARFPGLTWTNPLDI